MLRSVEKLQDMPIRAKDGKIGTLHDLYFDDIFWQTRYVVVDTGNWLTGKRVLISPESLKKPFENFSDEIPVSLTKDQVENSPPYDSEKPVSLRYERKLHDYYRWHGYWLLDTPYGLLNPSTVSMAERERALRNLSNRSNDNEYLRSTREVMRYFIRAKNGDIGHVEDFLVSDTDWRIHYLVLDTHNWLPGGKKVIVSPHWIQSVEWDKSVVRVELTQEVIENSPEFDYEKAKMAESMIS